jgi:hypothetical protein
LLIHKVLNCQDDHIGLPRHIPHQACPSVTSLLWQFY